MSAPGNTNPVQYITHQHAVDVNRMTGIPLRLFSDRQRWRAPDTHFEAVDQGVVHLDDVHYDPTRLEWLDSLRIAFALGAGYYYFDMRHPRVPDLKEHLCLER